MSTYANQVEAMLMQSDIEEGLDLQDVKFTGRGILAEAKYLYLETHIVDADGYKTTHWVALNDDKGLLFSDEQPDGLHKASLGV
jgi:hypothetical protein